MMLFKNFKTMRTKAFFIIVILISTLGFSQQDPQYTQYMYNTQIINPAYAGSRGILSFGLLGRSQWVNINGAPNTVSFTVNSPMGKTENMGLGLSVVHDQIGPVTDSNVNVDYAYTIYPSYHSKLSFGLKAGLDILNIDYTKLNLFDAMDPRFQTNVDNKLQPQIGAGIMYATDNLYLGLSVPNFLTTRHYDDDNLITGGSDSVAAERVHYYFIGGYVFNLSSSLKFKPATMIKAVSGAPLQLDASANFMFNDKFTLGAAYRWDSAISGLVGFQVSDNIFIGAAYDYQTSDLKDYSNGSYELIFRFDVLSKQAKAISPRFF